ncbi:MAG: hypothetical protein WD767_14880 [Alphaproteobacteria bacterium]
MARRIRDEDLQAIEVAVARYPDGANVRQIEDALELAPPRRTLQYRLKSLVDDNRLVMEGEARWARYRVPPPAKAALVVAGSGVAQADGEASLPLSRSGAEVRN